MKKSNLSSFSSIDEEQNLRLDRPGKGKTAEQLKKHTIDTNVENRPIDRALYILSSGDDIQKISIIQSLPSLVSHDSSATWNRIIPKIQQDLPASSSEYQIAASASFRNILSRNTNKSILNSIIQGTESKDPNVSFAWTESLCDSITDLPEETVQTVVFPYVKNKVGPQSSVASRIFSCRLIGRICDYSKLKLIDAKKDILPMVTSLCQDVSPDVRAAVCSILAKVAAMPAISSDITNTNLLSCLVELAHDDNVNVRGSAITTINLMMPILSDEIKKQTIVPLVKTLCDRALANHDTTSLTLSEEIGGILSGLSNAINYNQMLYFINIFKQLSTKGKTTNRNVRMDASKDVICRERCASNVVEVLKVALMVTPDQVNNVYAIYKDLVVDPCYLVRRAAASSVVKLAQLLGDNNKMMKNEIVRLLRDDAVEVLDLLVPSISLIFMSLYNSQALNYYESNQATTEIGKALLKCNTELSKGYNWRLTVSFLTQLQCLPMCMPSDYIHNNFTPILLDKVVNGKAKPIRIQALHVLVVFMRYNFKANQSKFIRDSIIKQTALSKNCYNRVLYINACEAVLNTFSEKYFKEFFLTNCLALATDKIDSVRWKFASFISKLKNLVTIHTTDSKTKQLIMDTIYKLEQTEKDKSVQEILKLRRRDPPFRFNQTLVNQEEKRIKEESSTIIKLPPLLAQQQPKFFRPPGSSLLCYNYSIPEKHLCADALGSTKNSLDAISPTVVSDINKLEHSDFDNIPTTNLTDDVKVNIRNIRLKNNSSDRTKRHSSVLSSNCLLGSETRTLNRRSLNLGGSDSKIPVLVCKAKSLPVRSKLPILTPLPGKSAPIAASQSVTSTHGGGPSLQTSKSQLSFRDGGSKSNLQLSKTRTSGSKTSLREKKALPTTR